MEIPDNFLGIEEKFSDYDKSKVVILPIPYEGTVTYGKGTLKGPKAIIEASKNLELYDIELDEEIYKAGIHTLSNLDVEKEPEKTIEIIYKKIKKLLEDNKFVVVFGGEHSITSGTVKAMKEKFSDLSVLQIDAHSDLRDSYDGTKFSHACVMRRIFEMKIPFVQVGIRSQDIEEADFIKEKRLNPYFAKDIYKNDNWMNEAVDKLAENVFITIDLDGLDPSIMPSTGTPEPGGLYWYHILRLLRKVAEKKNIVGFDVVELAPIENLKFPDFLAAKLTYKLIGYKYFLKGQ